MCLSSCLSGRLECHIIDPWVIKLSETFNNHYFGLSLSWGGGNNTIENGLRRGQTSLREQEKQKTKKPPKFILAT